MSQSQITGSPTAYKFGRRVLLVSYVSVGEWQTFGELVKLDEKRAVAELVYYALRRATPANARPRMWWWARRYKKALTGLVALICKLSMPAIPEGNTPIAIAKEAENNMKTAFRQLSMMYGWTPAEISDMSPAQLSAYMSGGKDGTGSEQMSGAEYKSFRARRGLPVGGLN